MFAIQSSCRWAINRGAYPTPPAPAMPLRPMNLLSTENTSKNYADRWQFKNLAFGLPLGQRVVFVCRQHFARSSWLKEEQAARTCTFIAQYIGMVPNPVCAS